MSAKIPIKMREALLNLVLIAAVVLAGTQTPGFAAAPASPELSKAVDAISHRDYPTALKLLTPLAESGNVAAQINLGNLYMKGLGAEQDYAQALHWYQRAADQDARLALSKVGVLHYYGLGVPRNPREAMYWFERAAEKGDAAAQATLGTLYALGEDGIRHDPARAYYWYTRATESGDKEAETGRKTLEEELTPGQRDEALRLLGEARKRNAEADEREFEAATAKLTVPPPAVASGNPQAEAASQKKSKTSRRRKKQKTGESAKTQKPEIQPAPQPAG